MATNMISSGTRTVSRTLRFASTSASRNAHTMRGRPEIGWYRVPAVDNARAVAISAASSASVRPARRFFLFRLVTGQGKEDVVEARPVKLQVDDVDPGAVEVAHQARQLARPILGWRRDPSLRRIHVDLAGEVTAGDF